MKCADMFDQAVHGPANRIDVAVLVAYCTRILAIRGMAFEREALTQTKFAGFHDFCLVAVFDDGAWRALADHPEVVGGYVEGNAAGGAGARAAGCEGGGERFVAGVLKIEAVMAEELVAGVHYGGGGALGCCN
jgi:hypothetical protein